MKYSKKGIQKYNFFVGFLRSFPRNLVVGYLGGLIPSSLFGAIWCIFPSRLNAPMKSALFRVMDVRRSLKKTLDEELVPLEL